MARPPPLQLETTTKGSKSHPPLDMPSRFPTGYAAPALSPLDAFAMSSRSLAMKFESKAGRRISRLSPVLIMEELANRPSYFRSQKSNENIQEDSEARDELGVGLARAPTVSRRDGAKDRPVSSYTVHCSAEQHSQADVPGYFGLPRALSPEPDPKVNIEAPSPNLTGAVKATAEQPRSLSDGMTKVHAERNLLPLRSPMIPKSSRSMQSIRALRHDSEEDDSSASARKFSGSSGISGPRSPHTPSFMHSHRSPSITSEYSVNGFSTRPAMNFSRPDRPMSPEAAAVDARSSMDSRRSFESAPSVEAFNRQFSKASSATTQSTHSARIPKPFANEGNASDSDGETYTYTKFALPRGRIVDREAPAVVDIDFRSSWIEKQFNWDSQNDILAPPVMSHGHGRKSSDILGARPYFPAAREHSPASVRSAPAQQRTASPMSIRSPFMQRPASPLVEPNFSIRRSESPAPIHPSFEVIRSSSPGLPFAETRRPGSPRHTFFSLARPSSSSSSSAARPASQASLQAPPSFEVMNRPASPLQQQQQLRGRGHKLDGATQRSQSADPRPKTSHAPSPSTATDATDQTVTSRPRRKSKFAINLEPDEHLETGIHAYTSGHFAKATYHLRLAAKAGLPSGMLLYALACQAGLGMKQNKEQGVHWLRRAIYEMKLDVDTTLTGISRKSGLSGIAADAELKRMREQVAMAIFELGVAHSKGDGCQKDATLALKLFETAAQLGDTDAICEAGYCYAQGLGCKKDMKKAAQLYRQAAELGMSMTGQSWIYKEKYDDGGDAHENKHAAAKGDGSRTKSMWSRKNKELAT